MEHIEKPRRPGRIAMVAFWSLAIFATAQVTGTLAPIANGAVNLVYGGPCGTLEGDVVSASEANAEPGGVRIIGIIDQKQISHDGALLECSGTAMLNTGDKLPITFRIIEDGGKLWVGFNPA